MRTQSRHNLKFQALLAERAHFMRHNLTETEQLLWRQLAGKRLGVAFKRQVPVDRYVVDFLAPAVKLVVEVDGGYHSQRVAADARRTRVFERLRYRVLRLEAGFVSRQLPLAVEAVRNAIRTLRLHSAP